MTGPALPYGRTETQSRSRNGAKISEGSEGLFPGDEGDGGTCKKAGRLHNETRIIGPVGACVYFDWEGTVGQKEQTLRSLRPKSAYSCLSSQDTEYRCLKQSRCLKDVHLKVVWAG